MERQILHRALQDKRRNTWLRERTKVAGVREAVVSLSGSGRYNAYQSGTHWKPWLGKRAMRKSQMRWIDDADTQVSHGKELPRIGCDGENKERFTSATGLQMVEEEDPS